LWAQWGGRNRCHPDTRLGVCPNPRGVVWGRCPPPRPGPVLLQTILVVWAPYSRYVSQPNPGAVSNGNKNCALLMADANPPRGSRWSTHFENAAFAFPDDEWALELTTGLVTVSILLPTKPELVLGPGQWLFFSWIFCRAAPGKDGPMRTISAPGCHPAAPGGLLVGLPFGGGGTVAEKRDFCARSKA